MGKQKFYPIILSVLYLLLGFSLAPYIKINISHAKISQIKLIEVLQLLVPIIIALIIASYINKKVFISHRKSEICLNMILEFEKKIQKVNGYMYEYSDKKKKDLKNKILALLKDSSIDLNLIASIEESKKKYFKFDKEILKEAFLSFKIALTGAPFEEERKKVTSDEINEMTRKYNHLLVKTLECKLSIFE